MKKFLVILVATMTLISLYVTPLWGMESEVVVDEVMIDETDVETNESDDMSYLQAGVEEVLNIDTDIEEEEVEDISIDETVYTGWSTAIVNIRKKPTTNSDIYDVLEFNEKIEYQLYSDKWVRIDYNGTPAYVAKRYISNTKQRVEIICGRGSKNIIFVKINNRGNTNISMLVLALSSANLNARKKVIPIHTNEKSFNSIYPPMSNMMKINISYSHS